MFLNTTIEQLRPAIAFVDMARSKAQYSRKQRHSFLAFAVMHICQAAAHSNDEHKWGFSIEDYKHILIKAVESVMDGKPIEEVMETVPTFEPPFPIDWNYFMQNVSDGQE